MTKPFHDCTQGDNLVGYITYKVSHSKLGKTATSDQYYPRHRLEVENTSKPGRTEGLGSILEILAVSDLSKEFGVQYVTTTHFPTPERKKQLKNVGILTSSLVPIQEWMRSHSSSFKKYLRTNSDSNIPRFDDK